MYGHIVITIIDHHITLGVKKCANVFMVLSDGLAVPWTGSGFTVHFIRNHDPDQGKAVSKVWQKINDESINKRDLEGLVQLKGHLGGPPFSSL